ncbi:SigE family RNA polymerase sigma factor [Cellulomonas marina]|uniref:SigE family RNA polymerase sigma factor n=1 Tax=Cellulomonas marina TaxID=988821 RepID=UPI000B7E47DF|nr:SigE family RNA polymerase sigma factor [Cellulomonas marina]GIG29552.1 RNA polymerase subunit sigma-24 [Cellulomonas marina]
MHAGDEVVAALVRERGRGLVAYAYLLTGRMGEAEDVVQDALVKTVVRARDGVDLDLAEAYVRRAILTTFVDGHRRRRRWQDLLPRLGAGSDRPAPDAADRVTAQVAVRAALATLPRRERACVVLRFYEDLSVPEIAGELGVSEGAVKRYLHTGTRRLEEQLGALAPTAQDDDDERSRA